MKKNSSYTLSHLSYFERFISLFTRVRAGEGAAVAFFFSYACLIIISYYIFKTLREPLIIGTAAAEGKSYATALAAVVLLFFMPIYSQLFRNLSREWLTVTLALAFSAMGLGFASLHFAEVNIAYSYYVWVSIYGVVMVAQFWVFAAGSFNVKSGKRLFPVILIGASLGGLIGARISGYVIDNLSIGSGLILASVTIGITALLPFYARDSVPAHSRCIDCHLYEAKESSMLGGLSVVLNSRLMYLIAIYALLLNIVNTSGEYLFAESLVQKADALGLVEADDREKFIGQTYAQFAFWVTAIALFTQMFFVSRLIIRFGVPIAVMIMPVVLTVGYLLGGFFPFFSFIYALKILDNSLDYSVTNTARQALFLPVSHEEKFEAKTAIDTLLWRLGDLIQAGIIYIAIHFLGWGIKEISVFCGVLCIVWVYFGRQVSLEYRQRVIAKGGEAPRLNKPLPPIMLISGSDFYFEIPDETFIPADPSDDLEFSAKAANGHALPDWLQFSAKKRTFSGRAPLILNPLEIILVARDGSGLSAQSLIKLQAQSKAENENEEAEF